MFTWCLMQFVVWFSKNHSRLECFFYLYVTIKLHINHLHNATFFPYRFCWLEPERLILCVRFSQLLGTTANHPTYDAEKHYDDIRIILHFFLRGHFLGYLLRTTYFDRKLKTESEWAIQNLLSSRISYTLIET